MVGSNFGVLTLGFKTSTPSFAVAGEGVFISNK